MTRLAVLLAVLSISLAAVAETPKISNSPTIEVYKTPTCGCCTKWIDHLKDAGFEVESTDLRNLSAVKQAHGISREVSACHTAVVDGYVIEGHVPAEDVQRLLRERPEVKGLVVPGMPLGSPGMEHPKPEPYSVYAIGPEGQMTVFSKHP
jgi:hypothetical protein